MLCSQALIVAPLPFFVAYSSQVQPRHNPPRRLVVTRTFCVALAMLMATYWLRFRLKSIDCNTDEPGQPAGARLQLVAITITTFARTFCAIKVVGLCVAKIRNPQNNTLRTAHEPFAEAD